VDEGAVGAAELVDADVVSPAGFSVLVSAIPLLPSDAEVTAL